MELSKKADRRSAKGPPPSLHESLLERYGPVMSGKALRETLCFSSAEAFRVAVIRGRVAVRTFRIEGRPGRFAVTAEVAEFLMRQHGKSTVDALTPLADASSRKPLPPQRKRSAYKEDNDMDG